MGAEDKIKNSAQDVTGQAKRRVGEATGDERLESEGFVDQTKAKFKKAGENVKDAAEDATDAVRDRDQ
jgi:uncharacterized protein YjbJ (UPF0337 family)